MPPATVKQYPEMGSESPYFLRIPAWNYHNSNDTLLSLLWQVFCRMVYNMNIKYRGKNGFNSISDYEKKSVFNLDFFSGGGEMGERIRSFDWSKTPLGPQAQWSQSLKTTVSICISSGFPMLVCWGPGLTMIYNDGYIPVVGSKHPQSLGQPLYECWHEIRDTLEPMFSSVKDEGKAIYAEDLLFLLERHHYTEETYFTFSYSPVYDETGAVGGVLVTCTETTEKVINERRLITLKDLAKSIAESKTYPDLYQKTINVLKQNPQDFPFAVIYEVNKDGTSLTMAGKTHDLKKKFPFCINLEKDASSFPWMAEANKTKKTVLFEDLKKHFGNLPAGAWQKQPEKLLAIPILQVQTTFLSAIIEIGVNPHCQLDDGCKSFYQLVADQVASGIAGLSRLEEERNRAEALEKIDKTKTVFFSNISHEFRTPVTLMLGPLEELINNAQGKLNEVENNLLFTTHRNAIRMLKLVNALLDFSRIESGTQKPNYTLTDIVSFTTKLASNFSSLIENAGLKFTIQADSSIEPVYVDHQMWEKIVFNLLSNAFKYTLDGSISLSISAENKKVVLSVTDTGVGIPEKELPNIFKRFHRVQQVNGRTYEGTGIGLSLVEELVKLLGGSIKVQSQEKKGSTFTVSIPYGTEHIDAGQLNAAVDNTMYESLSGMFVDEAAGLLETVNVKTNTQPQINNKKEIATVLVVDDNADMRGYLRSLLEKKYKVITARNGKEALEQVNKYTPDVVITDIMMPVMDGIQLLNEIKQNKITTNIPVILLTAHGAEESRIEGYESGADDYLVKPFSAKELMARVGSQLKFSKRKNHIEQQLKNIFSQAPTGICVLRGSDFIVELANEKMLELWNRTAEQMLNHPLFEAIPEGKGQGFEELLTAVYTTGTPLVLNEVAGDIRRNGKMETAYGKLVFAPLREEDGTISGVVTVTDEITEQVLLRKKIEQSEQVIRNMVLEAPIGICVMNAETFVSEIVNDRFVEIAGKPYEAIVGQYYWDTFAEIKHVYEAALKGVVETGIPYSANEVGVSLIRHGKEDTIFVTFVFAPLKNEEGKVTKIAVWVMDNTMQVVARQKISESENKLQFAIEATDLATWEIDPGTKRFTGDNRLKEWHGLLPGTEFDMQTGINVVVEEDREALVNAINNALEFSSGGNFDHQYSIVNPNTKQLRVVRAKGKVSFDAAQKPVKFAGTLQNVTEEVIANKKKEENERNLRLMILQAPIAIAILRGEDYVTEIANSRALEILGRKEEEVLNKPVFSVMPELLSQGIKELLDGVRTTGIRFATDELPVQIMKNNKLETVYINFSYEPLYDGEGKINGIMAIGFDVTVQVEARKKVEASETRYNLMLMQSPFAFLILKGKDMVVQLANESMKDVLGKGSDIEGKPLLEVLPEIKDQAFPELLDRVYTTGIPFSANEMLAKLHRNGKLEDVYFNYVYQPYYEADKTISGVTVIAYDVTSAVIANKKIEVSEKRFRNLIAQAVHPILIFKGEEMILEIANDALFKLWRVGEEVIGKPLLEILPEMKDQPFMDLLLDVYHNGATHYGNEQPTHFKRPSGEEYTLYFNFIYLPFRESDGSISGVITQGYDVTEQVKARHSVEESANQFTTLANSIQNLAWMARADGWIYWYNDRWYEYTGTTLQEMQGWGWDKVHDPNYLPIVTEKWKNAIDTGEPFEMVFPLKGKDGKFRSFLTLIHPLRDEKGKVYRWIGTNTDIDDERKIQQQLKLNQKQREDFIKMASHELKTPITIIKGYVQLVLNMLKNQQNELSPGLVKSSLVTIDKQVYRLSRLMSEMLDLSRIETGHLDLHKKIFNINELVDETVQDVLYTNTKHIINVSHDFGCSVNADRERIGQVIINLLTNAIKYSPKADRIDVKISKPKKNIVAVSVTDYGIGIAKEDHTKIFERFYRTEGKSEQTYPGFGVGLFLVNEIINRHDGTVSVESSVGKGAVFTFTLPCTAEIKKI